MKRKLVTTGLSIGALTIGLAPAAGAGTPSNFIGHAEYDAVQVGMTEEHVESIIAQDLNLYFETGFPWSDGDVVVQSWDFFSAAGPCIQTANFSFDNFDGETVTPGPPTLTSKSLMESGCENIVK